MLEDSVLIYNTTVNPNGNTFIDDPYNLSPCVFLPFQDSSPLITAVFS